MSCLFRQCHKLWNKIKDRKTIKVQLCVIGTHSREPCRLWPFKFFPREYSFIHAFRACCAVCYRLTLSVSVVAVAVVVAVDVGVL